MKLHKRSHGASRDPFVAMRAQAHRILDQVKANKHVSGGDVTWALVVTGDAEAFDNDGNHIHRADFAAIMASTLADDRNQRRVHGVLLANGPLICSKVAEAIDLSTALTRKHLLALVAMGRAFIVAESYPAAFTVDAGLAATEEPWETRPFTRSMRAAGTWEGAITLPVHGSSVFTLGASA